MDSEKNMSSETSSDQETGDSSKDGIGRLYECTFCKRGFTNAQALGGHMNIHRKDKAKAKQKNTTFTTKKDLLMVSPNPFKLIPTQETSLGFPMGDGYQFIPSTPNLEWNRALHEEERLRVDSNPGIGTSDMVENEVDLELRLGHYP